METKTCNACGQTFTLRAQNPNQAYCTDLECQRERRRRWQQQKRRYDADYRDNDARASKAWATDNPEYWKQYRDENPAYAQRNQNLQQRRNQKLRVRIPLGDAGDVADRQALREWQPHARELLGEIEEPPKPVTTPALRKSRRKWPF